MNMKNRTFYINIALTILLVAISALFGNELLQNKEFEKTYWDFEIHTSDKNQIKLVNYVIGNSKEFSAFALNDVNRDNNPFLLNSSDALKTYMSSMDDKKLYPNQLSIIYYSFVEKKFYQYEDTLLYNEIRNAGNSLAKERSLILTLLPKGKLKLSVRDNEDKSKEIFIQILQSKPIQGNFQLLNGDDHYTLQNIHLIQEYADLITKKYSYKISFSSSGLEELKLYSFAGRLIEPAFDTYEQNFVPDNIDVSFSKQECSETVRYYFDEKEILSTFEELSKNKTSSLELKGGVNKNKRETEFYLTNGSETILLKNKYPEKSRCL